LEEANVREVIVFDEKARLPVRGKLRRVEIPRAFEARNKASGRGEE
jgi:hypothetical protein